MPKFSIKIDRNCHFITEAVNEEHARQKLIDLSHKNDNLQDLAYSDELEITAHG